MKYLLGVDIGTSGARSAVLTEEGDFVKSAYTTHTYNIPNPGWAEQEADVYWESFCEVAKEAAEWVEEQNGELAGLSISGLTPDVLPINKKGEAIYPAILWLDRRGTDEDEWIRKNIGEEKVFELSANTVDPYYGLVELLWLKNKEPEIYKKAYKFLNVKDYVAYKVTGEITMDYTQAGCTGIGFDIRNKRWDPEMFNKLGLDIEKMPMLVECEQVIGHTQPEIEEATGLEPGIPVVAGAGDAMASMMAAGISEVGENVVALGTSAVWGFLGESDEFAKNMLVTPAVGYKDMYLTSAAPAFTGGVFKWMRDEIMKDVEDGAYDTMNEEAAKINPGADGLITLPYFAGERSPVWDARARGVVLGLSTDHTRAQLFRSGLEAVAFALLDSLKYIRESGTEISDDMVVTGGMAKSKLLREILANALNMNVIYIGGNVSAEVGVAYIAGRGVGIFDSYEVAKDKLEVIDKIEPDPEINEIYEDYYEKVYKKMHPALEEIFADNYDIRAKVDKIMEARK
ncbi:hypothetical protein LJ207_04490 [Halanaerobium sp. Z-7514]|uniref:Xylulokinase n=1 Tax=Halanaerobium polyolivorans TaxID=2886943 RepID=A0AAW4WU12_9FIRM|nr:FGGY family carbohydrate kinase [Halanaerobium polyolivorans]MCC3144582.1 hypothetical protein [Halanaerobium polyolivorans]RQD78059.1 MAG: hypothetical protein D5S01_01875 [Halanaerobium sp. MSAO_Bac5]